MRKTTSVLHGWAGAMAVRPMSTAHILPADQAHLHYEALRFSTDDAASKPPRLAVIVHGLLGSGRNWRSFSRTLGAAVKDTHADGRGWQFLLVDQRNHGKSKSRGHAGPHSIEASAQDLQVLLGGRSPEVLIGHSMGGKVVMEFLRLAQTSNRPAPQQTWMLDAMPGVVAGDPHNARSTIETLRVLPQPVSSRTWLAEYMKGKGFDKMVTDWVGTNLVEVPGTQPGVGPYEWAFHVENCDAMYTSYANSCMFSILESPPPGARIDVVRAANSGPWGDEVEARLTKLHAAGSVRIHVLEKAGHWVQMDNPSGLAKLMAPSFGLVK